MNTLKKINIILEELKKNGYDRIIINLKTNTIIFNGFWKRKIKLCVNVFFDFISYVEFYYKENQIKSYIKNTFIDKLKQFSNEGYNKNYHYSIDSDILKSKLQSILYEFKKDIKVDDNYTLNNRYSKIIISLKEFCTVKLEGETFNKIVTLDAIIKILLDVEYVISYVPEDNDIMSWIRENNGDAKKFRNLIKHI